MTTVTDFYVLKCWCILDRNVSFKSFLVITGERTYIFIQLTKRKRKIKHHQNSTKCLYMKRCHYQEFEFINLSQKPFPMLLLPVLIGYRLECFKIYQLVKSKYFKILKSKLLQLVEFLHKTVLSSSP